MPQLLESYKQEKAGIYPHGSTQWDEFCLFVKAIEHLKIVKRVRRICDKLIIFWV